MSNRTSLRSCEGRLTAERLRARRFVLLLTLAVVAVVGSGCEKSDAPSPGRHDLALAEAEVVERPQEEVVVQEDVALAEPAVALSFRRAPRENLDMDGDGFPAATDPDDADPRAFPLGPEVRCDGVDQDGDGLDACAADLDGDGVRADQDCDDADPEITPLAPEVRCNGEDENCDGVDDCDRDGDGYLDRDDFDPDDPAVTSAPSDRQPGEVVAEDVEF